MARQNGRKLDVTKRGARTETSNPLDQGVVITGELRVKLFGLNLLPIMVRLMIASPERTAELGQKWWSRAGSAGASVRSGSREPSRKTARGRHRPRS